MSLPVDKVKSDAARAEGNTSFKKGRWTESIGHYTTAILHDPEDPLAYGNRAQAYLRLDKYADAERDSSIVLEKQKDNVKALYRRSLARKGLERYDEAISDIRRLLELEPKNETALEDMEELKTLRDQVATKAKPRRPLSPSELTPARSSAVPKPDEAAPIAAVPIKDDSAKSATSSFASLKSSRASKKAAYIPPASSSQPTSATTNADAVSTVAASTTAESAIPASALGEMPTSKGSASQTQSPHSTAMSTDPFSAPTPAPPHLEPAETPLPDLPPQATVPTSAPHIPRPPTDPSSTAPGTGILLLRALSQLSPASAWSILRLYPPLKIAVILGPILEPDSLGTILLALEHAIQGDNVEKDKELVRVIMDGLRTTPRIGMNTMMLDPQAAKAGERAWTASGGTGSWP